MRLKCVLVAFAAASISGVAMASPSLIQVFDERSCDQVLTNGGFFNKCAEFSIQNL